MDQPFDASRVHDVIVKFGGNEVSHLAYVRDKNIYFYNEDGQDQIFFLCTNNELIKLLLWVSQLEIKIS